MNPDIVAYFFKSFYVTFSHDFSFTYFKALLNLLDKTRILVFNITFFKNDCCNFMSLCFSFINTWQRSLTVFGIATVCSISDFRATTSILGYRLRILCWMKRVDLSLSIRILSSLWNINYSQTVSGSGFICCALISSFRSCKSMVLFTYIFFRW